MPEPRFIYWDANVFISYLNNDPNRLPMLEAILEVMESSKNDRIVTSAISKVEVAWVAHERLKRALSTEEEIRMDALWNNPEVVEIVDFNDEIALAARKLMREGMTRGWKLTTNDAIHLASAQWVGAIELHTYDKDDLPRYSELLGLNICEPHTVQPKLF
jgi:predicted nucleic acid-binding protein